MSVTDKDSLKHENEYLRSEAAAMRQLLEVHEQTVLEQTDALEASLHTLRERTAKLVESEARTRAILDSAADAIISVDSQGIVRDFNLAAERIFGYEANEIIDHDVTTLIPHFLGKNHEEGADSSKSLGQTVEIEGVRKDGGVFPLELTVSEVRTASTHMFTVLARDISDRKSAEAAAAAHTVELEQRTAELDKSRRVAMNMMEDAQAARHSAEQLNDRLIRTADEIKNLMVAATGTEDLGKRFRNESLLRCWEAKQCEQKSCPAYGALDNLRCWEIAGTFCNGEVQGKLAKKLTSCCQCPTYQHSHADPVNELGETFNLMMAILQDRREELKAALHNAEAARNSAEQARELLAKSDQAFLNSFYASADAALLLANGMFVDCNEKAVQMLRASTKEEVLETHPSELSPETQPDGRSSFEKANEMIASALERGSNRFEWDHRRLDGEVFPVEVTLMPVSLFGKQMLVSLWKDIKELIEVRAAAEQAQKDTARALAVTETLLDAVPVGMIVVGLDKRIRRVNKNALRIMGGPPPEEIIGALCHQRVCPALEGACPVLDCGQRIDNAERVLIDREGRKIPILKTVLPIRLDGEDVLLESFVDITDRKKAEEDLRSSEARFRDVALASSDWIWEVDAEGRYTFATDKVADVLGYTADEVIGKSPFDFMTPEEARRVGGMFMAFVHDKRPMRNLENWNVTKDGRRICLLTSGAPILDESGALLGYRGVDADITNRKQAEAELEKVHKELLQVSRMAGMSEVATGVLHNVGNVLNSVNVAANLVTEKLRKSRVAELKKAGDVVAEHVNDMVAFVTDHPQGKHLARYMVEIGKHLASEQEQMLDDLVMLRKNIEHIKEIVAMQQSYSRVSGVMEELSPHELIEDALRMRSASFGRHHIEIIREYEEVPPIMVDRHKVMQIIINLVGNAKHSMAKQHGSAGGILTLRLSLKENRISIEVADDGVGISKENLSRIFNHGYTTKKDGHGFGLHTSALAAKEMGGTLTVSSAGEGAGATFTLAFPVQRESRSETTR